MLEKRLHHVIVWGRCKLVWEKFDVIPPCHIKHKVENSQKVYAEIFVY